MPTFPKLKKYLMIRKNNQVSTNSWYIDFNEEDAIGTVFMGTESPDNKFFLECSECNEELGPVSDSNISHQCEYHSCPVEEVNMEKKLFCDKHGDPNLPHPQIHNCPTCRSCPICWSLSGMPIQFKSIHNIFCNEHISSKENK